MRAKERSNEEGSTNADCERRDFDGRTAFAHLHHPIIHSPARSISNLLSLLPLGVSMALCVNSVNA